MPELETGAQQGQTCPDCGSVKYEPVEGCGRCLECGYSPCK